jgi:hypothetical protein
VSVIGGCKEVAEKTAQGVKVRHLKADYLGKNFRKEVLNMSAATIMSQRSLL